MSEIKNERVIMEGTYCTNVVLRWLTTDLALTNKRFKGYDHNTLFSLLPLGKNEVTMPLKSIASVSTSTKFHLKRFVIGLVFTMIGIPELFHFNLFGLLFLVLGIVPLFNSYTSALIVTNNAGHSIPIQISILEKGNLQEFANKVNNTIAEEVA